MDDPQTVESKKLVHLVNRRALRRHQWGQAAGGHDLHPNVLFFLDALDQTVDQSDVTVKDSRLNRIDGVAPTTSLA